MAVHFVDQSTGEVTDKPATVGAVNMAGVLIFVALLIGFFVGGGVANAFNQAEIHDLHEQLNHLRETTVISDYPAT